MNADRLLALFEPISEAPDAIPRLRRFILDLAVRGKLVEQDPEDEPAEELIRLISTEKARLAQAGKIKRLKALPPITEEEVLEELPKGWSLSRLGCLIDLISGQHLQPSEYSENSADGLPYITGPSDFSPGGICITRYALVRKSVALKGQLLLTVKGSGVGKTAICDIQEVAISRQLMALTAIGWNDHYLALITHRLAVKLQSEARSLIPGISREDVENFVLPLPPLAEQHRIVAKVDELMALCDQLEAARQRREPCRERLVAASLQRLNQPSDEPEAFRSDARFALQVLPSLTSTPAQIKQLRQTILNLAVRGKLVEQDPEDEPAEEIPLANHGKGKSRIHECVNPPFGLPSGWAWRAVDTLAHYVTDGEHSTPPRVNEPDIPLVTAKNVRDGYMDYSDTDWVSAETAHKAWGRCKPEVGDLLMVCVGATTGRLSVLREAQDMVLVRSVALIRPNADVTAAYLELAIRSPALFNQIWANVKAAAQPCLYLGRIKSLLVPLPPLAEQHRIVAKVDELMALCDQLEQKLSQAEQSQRGLLEAVLREALVEPERMLPSAAGASVA